MLRTFPLVLLLAAALFAGVAAAEGEGSRAAFCAEEARRLLTLMGDPDWRQREAAMLAFERSAASDVTSARRISRSWPELEARTRGLAACDRAVLRARLLKADPGVPMETLERRLRIMREFERLDVRVGSTVVGRARASSHSR